MGEAEAIRAKLWGETGPDDEPRPAHEEVQALIDEYPGEEALFLEFKTGVGLFRRGKLDKDAARKVLSKAVSAFANASGGVIVWGVTDWEKARDEIPEPEEFPIDQARELRRYLRGVQTKVTLPAAPDVRHELIERPDGKLAYVATYVARSDGAPIQARSGEYEGRYYRRHSNGTEIMTHDEIADMFGRRPHPVLELAIKIEKAESSRNQLFFYVRLGIRNQGRGAARQPAFFVSWEQKAVYKSTGPGGLGPTTINYYREGFESTYIGGADDIIHAGTCLQVVELRGYVDLDKLNSPPQRGAYPLTLDVELHCIGGSSKEYHETITSERILQDLGLWRSAWDEEGEG